MDTVSSEQSVLALAKRHARTLATAQDDQMLLRLRLALQIPRFASPQVGDVVAEEARRLLGRIRRDQAEVDWRFREPLSDLSRFRVVRVPDSVADTIHHRFHYIGSRREGIHLAMVPEDWQPSDPPCTLFTFSQLDLAHVQDLIKDLGFETGNALVLSRSYTFRWAPRNSFSHGFAQCLGLLREKVLPNLEWLVSYVNSNVGFTGSSYFAAGWSILAREMATKYNYLDGDYITRRELRARYGTSDQARLSQLLGRRLQHSQISLAPLFIHAFPVSARAVRVRKRVQPSDLPNRS